MCGGGGTEGWRFGKVMKAIGNGADWEAMVGGKSTGWELIVWLTAGALTSRAREVSYCALCVCVFSHICMYVCIWLGADCVAHCWCIDV